MSRVKRGVTARRRHKRIIKQASGFFGRRKNTFRAARQAVDRAGQYAYRDRRTVKRHFRSLWIQRINAAVREHGITYAHFAGLLKKNNILIDRKSLAKIAYEDAPAFADLVAKVRPS